MFCHTDLTDRTDVFGVATLKIKTKIEKKIYQRNTNSTNYSCHTDLTDRTDVFVVATLKIKTKMIRKIKLKMSHKIFVSNFCLNFEADRPTL